MPMRRTLLLVRPIALLATVLLVLSLGASPGGAQPGAGPAPARGAADGAHAAGRYLVTFADEPVASYDGYEPGFAATRPQPGRKLDADSPAARRWQQRLQAEHDAAL